jgi:hypothetical protein
MQITDAFLVPPLKKEFFFAFLFRAAQAHANFRFSKKLFCEEHLFACESLLIVHLVSANVFFKLPTNACELKRV